MSILYELLVLKEVLIRMVNTLIVRLFFDADRDKVVCHLYNTTCKILVNGHGYRKLIDLFLEPFFRSRVDACLEEINKFNEVVLDNLGSNG